MGVFSFLKKSFVDGYKEGLEKQQENDHMRNEPHAIPPARDLLYPGKLLTFAELEAAAHEDVRALAYEIRHLDPCRKWPLGAGDFQAGDFGSEKKTVWALQKKGLVQEYSKEKIVATAYDKEELKGMLRSRGLPVGGNKPELAARLVASGFQVEKNRYKNKTYELTEMGRRMIDEERRDRKEAIRKATMALKEGNYQGAINAYREYDDDWGFVHASGKNHTIFAHYDIPFRRFEALEKYPMKELLNTEDFKNTLRACLIAGIMRGSWDKYGLAECFAELCDTPIICPKLMDYYRRGDFEETENRECILERMEENIRNSNRNALEYYIAYVFHKIVRVL